MTITACRRVALALAALLSPGLLGAPLAAQKSATEARVMPTPEAIARVKALMSKQKEHEVLGQLAGNWEGTLQAAVRTKADEVPAAATMNVRWILDGYFLESDDTIQLRENAPPTPSRTSYGYNTFKKSFYRIELQAGDPREFLSAGSWDAATRTLTFIGPEHNKITGDDFQRRDTFRFVGEDQLDYERSFVFQDKSEIRAFHGTLRRKKG